MFDLPVFSNLNGIDWAGQKQNVVVRIGSNGIQNTTDCRQAAISDDYGFTWEAFASCIPGVNSSTTGSGTIAIEASGKHLVWTATGTERNSPAPVTNVSGPYFGLSADTSSWSSPTGLDLQTPNISSDRIQPATFYSFTDGQFYVSTDGGKSYTSRAATSIGLPTRHDVSKKLLNCIERLYQVSFGRLNRYDSTINPCSKGGNLDKEEERGKDGQCNSHPIHFGNIWLGCWRKSNKAQLFTRHLATDAGPFISAVVVLAVPQVSSHHTPLSLPNGHKT